MKPESEALLRKARESLEAAKLLAKEKYFDFAASRAYCAMFYTAEALLLERALSFSSHSGVIAAFGKEFSKGDLLDPKFHRYLIHGQDLRNAGDYDTELQVAAAQIDELGRWAEEFLLPLKHF
jgi:uncharacterized protein (UPF0332 family)